MIKNVTLSVHDGIKEVARLQWVEGKLILFRAEDVFRESIQYWLDHGLREIVGAGATIRFRTTSAHFPEFPSRLGNYIKKITGFEVSVLEQHYE